MDESDGGEDGQRNRTRQSRSKTKYMNLLQDVADRKVDHITIELDDLDQVKRDDACTKDSKLTTSHAV